MLIQRWMSVSTCVQSCEKPYSRGHWNNDLLCFVAYQGNSFSRNVCDAHSMHMTLSLCETSRNFQHNVQPHNHLTWLGYTDVSHAFTAIPALSTLHVHVQQGSKCRRFPGENHIHVSSLPLPVHQLNRLSSRKKYLFQSALFNDSQPLGLIVLLRRYAVYCN